MLGYTQGDLKALPKATLSQNCLPGMVQDSFSPKRFSISSLQDLGELKEKPALLGGKLKCEHLSACRHSHRGRTRLNYLWHVSPELK